MKILIPGYIYPGAAPRTEWSTWIAHAPSISWIIGNPGSPGGPGTFTDTNYQAVFAAAQAAGIGIFGYVDTNFAAVLTATVTGQIDDWKTFYGINDIFFDNVSSGAGDLAYYTTVTNYVRSTHPGAQVMLNHGTDADIGYMALSDIQCTFEGPKSTYDTWEPAQRWEMNVSPTRICHLVYNCATTADVQRVVSQAKMQNVGHLHVVDTATGIWSPQSALLPDEFTAVDLLNLPRRVAGFGSSSGGRR